MWLNEFNFYKNIDGVKLLNNKYNMLLVFFCYIENFEFNIFLKDFLSVI